MKVVEISLLHIEWRDQSSFVRYAVDGDQVENLKSDYETGESVPPLYLFAEKRAKTPERAIEKDSDGDTADTRELEHTEDTLRYYIGDGWHRFHALRELGRPVAPAMVYSGGRRAAIKCALGANSGCGLRRTNKDKRNAVKIAIQEFPRLSNRAVAALCKVSHEMVNTIRQQLADSASPRQGRDGKMRRVAEQPRMLP